MSEDVEHAEDGHAQVEEDVDDVPDGPDVLEAPQGLPLSQGELRPVVVVQVVDVIVPLVVQTVHVVLGRHFCQF